MTQMTDVDINRLVQRIHTADATVFAAVKNDVALIDANFVVANADAQKRIVDEYRKQLQAKKIIELPSDGERLTLAELKAFRQSIVAANTTKSDQVKSAVSQLFTYQFQGNANLGLNAKTSINGSSMMPSVQFELAVNLPLFNFGNAEEANDNGFSVDLNNVQLDLGSFMGQYVEPILSTANDIIAPIKPIVTALNADTKLPGKLKLGGFFESDGKPGTSLLEIAKKLNTGGSEQAAKIDKAIKFADTITTLVEAIDSLTKNFNPGTNMLSFGDFSLDDLRAASDDPANNAARARASAPRTDGAPTPQTTLPNTNAADVDKQAKSSSGLRDKYNKLKKVEGLEFKVFEPSTLLSLLMGEKGVNLIKYDIPDFEFNFDMAKSFRIWGPIAGLLEGGFSVATDFSMGLDTAGFDEWRDTGFDPLKSYLVFDGIYVDDWNKSGGEKDELTVRAYVGAGVGIDVGIASGFVKGGIEGIIGFDLVDVGERSNSSDGKVRGSDIIHKLSTNPADLFDLNGTINVYLGAEVKVKLFFFKATVYKERFATFEIAKFKLSASGSGSSIGGKGQTGPIYGGTVWFDANDNFVVDDGEPVTTTDFEGRYELFIPDEVDTSHGTIRIEGGRDVSTGLPSHDDVAVPVNGHGNMTALTALEEALVRDGGRTIEQSQTMVETALGIDPSVDLSTFAHLDEALSGNPLAGPVMVGENTVNSAVSQIEAVLAGASGVSLDDHHYAGIFSEAAFIAISRQIGRGSLDLADRVQLQRILIEASDLSNQILAAQGLTPRVNTATIREFRTAVAEVIRATVLNQRAEAAKASDVYDLAHRVTQEKVLANGKVVDD
ncbi:MAG TPA: hypothetical protein PLV92_14190, partial [Pirellulaceae bacterium]|nr:hypothetical protein [Pirellulaceae bacterium]